MMPLILLAAASADLDSLNHAVARCDRNLASPAFAAETARRSQFLLDAFREQEAIVAARLEIASRRRLLREAADKKNSAEERALNLESAAIDDRQHALNDRRMLEGIRQDAMDSMRRHFLTNCPAGKSGK